MIEEQQKRHVTSQNKAKRTNKSVGEFDSMHSYYNSSGMLYAIKTYFPTKAYVKTTVYHINDGKYEKARLKTHEHQNI